MSEIKDILSGFASGLPVGEANQIHNDQINDLQKALPSEIARVSTQITKLERELEQLQECKRDISDNLFEGFDDGMGDIGKSAADI